MGKVLEAQEEMGKPILWGMGWVNRRLGIFGGHPMIHAMNFIPSKSSIPEKSRTINFISLF